jgi:hypothetical protein
MSGSIGSFTLGMQLIMNDDGTLKCDSNWMNAGVPIEMVALQIRAFLNQIEQDYFSQFDKDTASRK